jgi:uncharacterized protein YkwD
MNLFQVVSNFNWLDYLIIFILIVFFIDGWYTGFLALAAGFAAYAFSFYIAFKFHSIVGKFIVDRLGFTDKWTDAIGYILIIFIVQILLSQLLIRLLKRFVVRLIPYRIDTMFGGIFSLINTLVSLTLILLLIIALPVDPKVKSPIRASIISEKLFILADTYVKPLKLSVEESARKAALFITVNPQSREMKTLDINIQSWDMLDDEVSERKMYDLVNLERIKHGTVDLNLNPVLSTIARNYSRNMLIRKYFSHIDPDGKSVKDRLNEAKVVYSSAAENLAFAPTVEIAHDGLMASESHRKNILDPSFSQIGIGVVDAGSYGKMFTQIYLEVPYLIKHYP